MRRLAVTIAMALIVPTMAFAHSPLKSTFPADNAKMLKLPDRLSLEFGKPARLTKITLTHALAAVNKLRFVPALRHQDGSAARHLRQSISLEMAAVVLILTITAVLTTITPLPDIMEMTNG